MTKTGEKINKVKVKKCARLRPAIPETSTNNIRNLHASYKQAKQLTHCSLWTFITRAPPALSHSVTAYFQCHCAVYRFLATIVGDFGPALRSSFV